MDVTAIDNSEKFVQEICFMFIWTILNFTFAIAYKLNIPTFDGEERAGCFA